MSDGASVDPKNVAWETVPYSWDVVSIDLPPIVVAMYKLLRENGVAASVAEERVGRWCVNAPEKGVLEATLIKFF